MKQRLVIRLAVALGLCLIMGPYEKALASGNAGWLLGAVGEIKGEQEIVFFVEHGGSAGIQGNQKWQVEVGKELGNAMVNFKDTLNIQKSGEQLDNTLTVVISFAHYKANKWQICNIKSYKAEQKYGCRI